MRFQKRIFHVLQLVLLGSLSALAQGRAPEPNPPYIESDEIHAMDRGTAASGATLFSIGQPTDEEQFYLELINRARANATAEANRLLALTEPNVLAALDFFNTDTNLMKQQFATNPPVPPLSFNAKLITAARGHSQFQFDTVNQTHTGPGTNTLVQRYQAVGYVFQTGGENVFTTAENVEHGHAGFEVDWGFGATGMQTPPGHRNSIHNRNFREVGVGIVLGNKTREGTITNTDGSVTPHTFVAGPQVVTQDFGSPPNPLPYITGVAYYDLNGNNFYDLGEGLGGVTVTVDGVNTYAVTSSSGGYSIPVPANTVSTVRFQVSNGTQASSAVTVTNTDNVKVDYKPAFVLANVVSAPSITFAGAPNLLQLATLGGATGYRARVQQMQTPVLEGAETGMGNLVATVTGTNAVIAPAVGQTGLKSFRLMHVVETLTAFPGLQTLQFNNSLYVRTNAKIDFKSRLGVAGTNQFAKLEISDNNGLNWAVLWSQRGNQTGALDNSEKVFTQRSVNLSNYVGKAVQVRFSYSFEAGNSIFVVQPNTQNPSIYGLYLDDIAVSNADLTLPATVSEFGTDGGFQFVPPATGNYLLQFQAFNGAHSFPWGDARYVTAQANPPVLSLVNNVTRAGGNVSFQFTVNSGTVTPFALNSASSIVGPWSRESGAIFSGPSGGRYAVTVPTNGLARYYRVLSN